LLNRAVSLLDLERSKGTLLEYANTL